MSTFFFFFCQCHMQKNLIVLILISLTISEAGYLFKCILAICISFENYLLISLAASPPPHPPPQFVFQTFLSIDFWLLVDDLISSSQQEELIRPEPSSVFCDEAYEITLTSAHSVFLPYCVHSAWHVLCLHLLNMLSFWTLIVMSHLPK